MHLFGLFSKVFGLYVFNNTFVKPVIKRISLQNGWFIYSSYYKGLRKWKWKSSGAITVTVTQTRWVTTAENSPWRPKHVFQECFLYYLAPSVPSPLLLTQPLIRCASQFLGSSDKKNISVLPAVTVLTLRHCQPFARKLHNQMAVI